MLVRVQVSATGRAAASLTFNNKNQLHHYCGYSTPIQAASNRTIRFQSTNPRPSMLFDSVSDMIASLRLKAINSLTNSLSESERNMFLEKFQASSAKQPEQQLGEQRDKDSTELEDLKINKSIAEAVAEARLEEAKRANAERQAIQEEIEAERAAHARVKAEYQLMLHEQDQAKRRNDAYQIWKEKVEEARKSIDNGTSTKPGHLEEFDENKAAPGLKAEMIQEPHHPVLGPVVSDLGYKRIYKVDPRVLSNIPIWEKQRIYRHDRAKVMAADKMKSIELGLVGNICLHEDSNGKLRILDGQHRVGMITILAEKIDLEASPLRHITVEVYRVPQRSDNDDDADHDDSHAKSIFVEVNKAESVKVVDMPGVAKGADRKTISEAAARLKNKFPEMFKPSQSCRPPHLNIDNLRDNIFAAGIIQKHGLTSAAALEKWMLAQNNILESKYNDGEVENKAVSDKALEKARKFNFYLGLDASWYYN